MILCKYMIHIAPAAASYDWPTISIVIYSKYSSTKLNVVKITITQLIQENSKLFYYHIYVYNIYI